MLAWLGAIILWAHYSSYVNWQSLGYGKSWYIDFPLQKFLTFSGWIFKQFDQISFQKRSLQLPWSGIKPLNFFVKWEGSWGGLDEDITVGEDVKDRGVWIVAVVICVTQDGRIQRGRRSCKNVKVSSEWGAFLLPSAIKPPQTEWQQMNYFVMLTVSVTRNQRALSGDGLSLLHGSTLGINNWVKSNSNTQTVYVQIFRSILTNLFCFVSFICTKDWNILKLIL